MRVTEERTRFSPRTGERAGTVRVTRHHRCDYCGKVLHETEGDEPALAVRLVYRDGTDECFGSDGAEYDFSEEHGVDMHGLLGQPYCFCNPWNGYGESCERALVTEFVTGGPSGGMPPLRREDARDLQGTLRAARVRAAQKLIAAGEITPRELEL